MNNNNNNTNDIDNKLNDLLDMIDNFAGKENRGTSDFAKLLIATSGTIWGINECVIGLLNIDNIYKALINGLLFIGCFSYTFYTCRVDAKKWKEEKQKEDNRNEAKKLYDILSELIDKGDAESISKIEKLSVKYAYSEVKISITDMGIVNNKHRYQVVVDYDIYKNKILAYEQ